MQLIKTVPRKDTVKNSSNVAPIKMIPRQGSGDTDVVDINVVVPISTYVTKVVSRPITRVVSVASYVLKTLVLRYMTRYASSPVTIVVTRPQTVFNTVVVSSIVSYVSTKVVSGVAGVGEGEEKVKESGSTSTIGGSGSGRSGGEKRSMTPKLT